MSVELQEQCAELTTEARAYGNSPCCLFVSTSLATWTTANPERFARDFQINDTVYRRLDPEYYVWLRSRMVVAKRSTTTGHLDAAAFEDLRVRFNAVHAITDETFLGELATSARAAVDPAFATLVAIRVAYWFVVVVALLWAPLRGNARRRGGDQRRNRGALPRRRCREFRPLRRPAQRSAVSPQLVESRCRGSQLPAVFRHQLSRCNSG